MSKALRSFTSAGMPTHATFTAELVEHTPYSRRASCVERTILVITVHNDPDTRSVTNAIDEVLLACRARFGADLPSRAIDKAVGRAAPDMAPNIAPDRCEPT